MTELTDTLCLQCGLCCNGVLFADVRRGRGDPSALFTWNGPRVPQPCPAFNHKNCTCALYTDRPVRCRKFECKQLLAARDGETTVAAALKKISEAQKLAAKAEALLERLAYNQRDLPLNDRFLKCQRAAEQGKIDGGKMSLLADLQLTIHRLNLLLAQHFYA